MNEFYLYAQFFDCKVNINIKEIDGINVNNT